MRADPVRAAMNFLTIKDSYNFMNELAVKFIYVGSFQKSLMFVFARLSGH